MKERRKIIGVLLTLCVVVIAVILISNTYFQYISQKIYEHSTSHLMEVYSQVNSNFTFFLEKTWGDLEDWANYLVGADEEDVLTYIQERQQRWQFSQFYFLSQDGRSITAEGVGETLLLEDSKAALFERKEPIMCNETLPSGQMVTLFAVPVPKGTYRGFDYDAIAVSYTNADMIATLDVDVFSGQSMCLVVQTDGNVFLSTNSSGSAFKNYISYLRNGSDMDENMLNQMLEDWKNGISDVIRCRIGGVSYYISYLPVGYEDCILLGIVPEQAASDILLRIQKSTIDMLLKVFLLLGGLAAVWVIHTYRQKTKKSALELRYREIMFDMLSNNIDDIFLMLDEKTWNVDYLSPNIKRLLGISPEEIKEDIHSLEKSAADKNAVVSRKELESIPLQGSRSWEREHIHLDSGERKWYWETVYHANIQDVRKYVIVMSDRTKERQMSRNLEDALADARSANEAKSHFLSNMSHDIRTPMNAIIGFASLLEKDAGNEDKVREYTRKISTSGQHLVSLINDVLDMSKIESGKTSLNVTVFSLPELMEELYNILLPQAHAKQQTFEFHTRGCFVEQLLGDKLRLNQILINLLSNAIKYTQDGGTIDFTVQELPASSPQFATLRFVVADNGMGMSEEFLNNIFDSFSREANSTISGIQGTGLGMAITKNLVDLMGGTIRVESKKGEGSIFTVELTFAIPAQNHEKEIWDQCGVSRVLVADDELEICQNIQSMMREKGVAVEYVTDGKAAVDAAMQAKEQGDDFHVILLDWKMPELNGVEAARRIREQIPENIPILVLTSYDWGDIEEEARAAGIDAFMSKPFFVSNFQRTLAALHDNRIKPDILSDAADEKEEKVFEGMLFLAAEDVELNAEILSEVLSMEGATCDIAVNGREALEKFLQSEPGHYDMILMDVQMPVMDGYEATRQIRASSHPNAKTIPIVAMTANAFAEDVQKALDSGMNGHLSKPFDFNAAKTLLGRLKKSGTKSGAESGADSDAKSGTEPGADSVPDGKNTGNI